MTIVTSVPRPKPPRRPKAQPASMPRPAIVTASRKTTCRRVCRTIQRPMPAWRHGCPEHAPAGDLRRAVELPLAVIAPRWGFHDGAHSKRPIGPFSRSLQVPCRSRPLPRRLGSEDLARLTHPRAPRLGIGVHRLEMVTADTAEECLEHGGRHTRDILSKPLNPRGPDYGSPSLAARAANQDALETGIALAAF